VTPLEVEHIVGKPKENHAADAQQRHHVLNELLLLKLLAITLEPGAFYTTCRLQFRKSARNTHASKMDVFFKFRYLQEPQVCRNVK
jgi:hypothetical protein